MARKKSSRRRGTPLVVLRVNSDFPMGTALAQAVVTSAITNIGGTRFRMVAADLYWAMHDHTANEGPVEVGLSNGDLTVTEIAEALDASPISPADIIALERARRPVRRSGMFSEQAGDVLNEGKPIRTKFRTTADVGIEINAWARNLDDVSMTTGTIITVTGKIYGHWA